MPLFLVFTFLDTAVDGLVNAVDLLAGTFDVPRTAMLVSGARVSKLAEPFPVIEDGLVFVLAGTDAAGLLLDFGSSVLAAAGPEEGAAGLAGDGEAPPEGVAGGVVPGGVAAAGAPEVF